MNSERKEEIRYSILDPAGNITALVETKTEISRQPFLAARIMEKHPDVEQVGFVTFEEPENDPVMLSLRMAGGEFCGNAAMCAAALYLEGKDVAEGIHAMLELKVSGADKPVRVELEKETPAAYGACVAMPEALGMESRLLEHDGIVGEIPFVRMQGISHLIIEENTPFSALLENRNSAEQAARKWAEQISQEGLGLMFLQGNEPELQLIPLVCIPESGTLFWEHSCGSGSSACGVYFSEKKQNAVKLIFHEPGGDICVSGSLSDGIFMKGHVKLKGRFRL